MIITTLSLETKSQQHTQQSESFLRQYIQTLEFKAKNVTRNLIDIAGITQATDVSDAFQQGFFSFGGGMQLMAHCATFPHMNYAPFTTGGIRVGSGTTTVTSPDIALQTPIEHGNAAGHLDHLGCGATTVTVSGINAISNFSRFLINSSGGTVTITETGIYNIFINTAWNVFTCCIARDLLTTSVNVLAGETLKVNYKFRVVI